MLKVEFNMVININSIHGNILKFEMWIFQINRLEFDF